MKCDCTNQPRSLWLKDVVLPEFPKLKGDVKTDVLIIGGGMAGILTAFLLKESGVDHILVERDRICHSTTGNTTAKLTVQHGLLYQKIVKTYGVESAQKYWKANEKALQKYAALCKDIPCDFEVKDNYVYSLDNRGKLEAEMDALDRIGCHAELVDDVSIPLYTAGAIRFSRQAQFHPMKFIAHIVKELTVFEHTPVVEMIGRTAVTDAGKIHAKAVVCATHFPFVNKHGMFFLKLYQHRSYVIALQNAAQIKGMYVDEDRAGLSFRNAGDLLLLGGSGHRTGKPSGAWDELRDFSNLFYPTAKEVGFWAAQDCMSLDGIPYIGRYSKSTNGFYVATGFNKWGMTGSMTAAMLLRDMLLGHENVCADVFSPSRSIWKPQLALNSAEAVKDILRFSEKRCPHMGCALQWNPNERSWDCPCHGSRFASCGALLNNPANADLK